MANEFITVRGTRYPVPHNSSTLWRGEEVINGKKPPANLFHVLLEDKGAQDDQGRPIFTLSDKIAVHYAVLEHNDRQGNPRDLLLAAYKKAVDAQPDKFITISELNKGETGRSKMLSMLFGQWAIFHQPELSLHQPRLFAMTNPYDGKFFLPGSVVSSMADLDALHNEYVIIRESDFLGAIGVNLSGTFVLAGDETATDKRRAAANAERRVKRVALKPLDPTELGLDGSGIVLRDDAGKETIIPGHVNRVQGRINLAQFGLTHYPSDMGKIALFSQMQPNLTRLLLSERTMRWGHDYASEQIQVITRALVNSGAWQRGVAQLARRVPRWVYRNVKHHLGIGSGN